MRDRYLTIPKNAVGKNDYDYGVENSENMEVYFLPEEEFEILITGGYFDKINAMCETMIDDYESSIIENNMLSKCSDILLAVSKNIPVFYKAISAARKYNNNTFVALDF